MFPSQSEWSLQFANQEPRSSSIHSQSDQDPEKCLTQAVVVYGSEEPDGSRTSIQQRPYKNEATSTLKGDLSTTANDASSRPTFASSRTSSFAASSTIVPSSYAPSTLNEDISLLPTRPPRPRYASAQPHQKKTKGRKVFSPAYGKVKHAPSCFLECQ